MIKKRKQAANYNSIPGKKKKIYASGLEKPRTGEHSKLDPSLPPLVKHRGKRHIEYGRPVPWHTFRQWKTFFPDRKSIREETSERTQLLKFYERIVNIVSKDQGIPKSNFVYTNPFGGDGIGWIFKPQKIETQSKSNSSKLHDKLKASGRGEHIHHPVFRKLSDEQWEAYQQYQKQKKQDNRRR